MSEKLERIQLNDEQTESIGGGMLCYYSVRDEVHYMYSDYNPDKKYVFNYSDFMKIKNFVRKNCKGMTDEAALSALVNAGLIQG